MKRLLKYMVRLGLAVMLPMLIALAPALAQTVVYQNTTTTLEVVQMPGDTYRWELYSDPTVDFAKVPGNCPPSSAIFTGGSAGPSVNVLWIEPGIYFYKATAWNASGCTDNLKVGMIKVIPYDVEAIIAGATQSGACLQVALDASTSKGELISYEWSVLDPGVALTSLNTVQTTLMLSPSYNGILPSDFRVMLRVTNRDGKSDNDTLTVQFNPAPVADIYSTNQPEKDGSMIVDGSVSSGIGLNYRWSTAEGKVVGPADSPSAYLLGKGLYTLEVTDAYGCKSAKTFMFPLEQYQIIANPDYARTSWAHDTTIFVLNNDISVAPINPLSVRVISPPDYGETKVNPDGSVVYTPTVRKPGRDYFIYEVCDVVNLCDSALVTIDVYDAGVDIIEGFSPNGDGVNEYMVFKGLEHYPLSHLHVYTRSGQLVYRSMDYLNDWDGRTLQSTITSLELVPTGVYYYVLELGGTNRVIKGFVYIGY